MDYWREAVECALEEAGVTATEEQISALAEVIAGAHENYGMAMGHDVASANFAAARQRELDDALAAAERERQKVHCRECDGRGRVITRFGTMQSDTECWKCRGVGRHDP